ncbi:MAG: DUF4037 domain-containing protein [Faecalibacterium sp.]|nr:DUF4037 domain-containing protein [Faecalibacterium sp.]
MSGPGMALSRRYWQQCGLPALQAEFAQLAPRVAAGLLGEGSECLGFDDEISRDHDWGPGFCLWLPADLYQSHGAALADWYRRLPQSFEGWLVKTTPGRVGVFEQTQFFARFVGAIPQTGPDWLFIPEQYLSVATAGEVFYDPSGEFTHLLQTLRHCPEPVRQKRLAARCVTMMQSGQYNYPRCIQRGECFAADLALREFVLAACSAIFLLNGQWMPFYKWLPRALAALPRLGQLTPTLQQLLECPDDPAALVHTVCAAVADELRCQNLTALPGCDMQQLGLDLQAHIADPALRALPVLAG